MTMVNKTKSLPSSFHKSAYINEFFCIVIYAMKKIKQGCMERIIVRWWDSQGIPRNYHVTRLHRSQSSEDLGRRAFKMELQVRRPFRNTNPL